MTWFATLLLACSASTGWQATPIPVDGFEARQSAVSASGPLVGGKDSRNLPVVVRFDGKEVESASLGTDGFVTALATLGDSAWAIVRHPTARSDERLVLYRSNDAGATWREVGRVPFSSVTQLAARSSAELWVLGPHTLARTTDTGASWQPVAAPGDRNSLTEHLVVVDGTVALLGPTTLTSDDGASWSSQTHDANPVGWSNGVYLGSTDAGPGYSRDGTWHTLPDLPAGARPLTLRASGDYIDVLIGAPTGPSQHRVTLLRSDDQGAHWTSSSVAAQTFDPTWAIGPDRTAYVLGLGFKTLEWNHP